MKPSSYRLFLVVAILLVGSLLAAPLWDRWYYRPPGNGPSMPIASGSISRSRSVAPIDPPASQASMTGIAPTEPTPVNEARRATPALEARAPAAVGAIGRRVSESTSTPLAQVAPPPVAPMPQRSAGGSRAPSPASNVARDAAGGSIAPRSVGAPLLAAGWVPMNIMAAASTPSPAPPPVEQADTPAVDPAAERNVGSGGQTQPSGTSDQDSGPRLSLVPNGTTVAPGQTVKVSVVLQEARGVTSVPFHVQFNPAVLQYVGAKEGALFTSSSLQPILLASVDANRPGDLAVGLALVDSSGFLNASGHLVELEFLALGSGQSDLLFDRASVRGPTSREMPLRLANAAIQVR